MRRAGTRLSRSWFERAAPDVAPDLLNKLLVATVDGERVAGRIIEVEAYTAADPASHSFRGPTPRNAPMFGRAAHLYVYLSYGIHRCANVVTGRQGAGEAVLLRAAQPMDGIDVMRRRRGVADDRRLADGPGKLAQAFAIDLHHDGIDLVARDSPIELRDDGVAPPTVPVTGPRVGLTKGVDTPWRFRVPAA